MHFVVLLSSLVACAAGVPVTSTNPKLQARVYHGSEVKITKVPFQLSLTYYSAPICGAVIIGSRWALTAAHCVKGMNRKELRVSAGSSLPMCGEIYKVEPIPHKLYNSTTRHYDIALLEAEKNFILSERVQPIPLLNHEDEWLYYLIGAVSGWGEKADKGLSKNLQMAFPILVYNSVSCKDYLYFSFDLMFCAIGPKGEDACLGDSGGPLFASRNDISGRNLNISEAKLIGIVSSGKTCGDVQFPTMYTRISAVSDWINETTGI